MIWLTGHSEGLIPEHVHPWKHQEFHLSAGITITNCTFCVSVSCCILLPLFQLTCICLCSICLISWPYKCMNWNTLKCNKDKMLLNWDEMLFITDLVALRIEEHLGDFGEGPRLSQCGDRLTVVPLPESHTAISTSCQVWSQNSTACK